MAAKKSKSSKSKSSSKRKSSVKRAAKPAKKAKRASSQKKTVKKPAKSVSSYTPSKTMASTQKKAINPQDILEKYKNDSGYSFDKPSSLEEFDKHLEETAKLVSKDKDEKKALPHFSDEHIQKGEQKQSSSLLDDEKSPFDNDPAESMVDQLKKPETPDPDHKSLSSEHSHPFTEQPSKDSLFDHKDELHPHHRHAINAIVLAFIGVLVPVLSIVAFFMALHSTKNGSETGKGAILLSVATFVINLVLIYIFYTFVIAAPTF